MTNPDEVQTAIARIRQMERYFDRVQAAAQICPEAVARDPVLREMTRKLISYYDGGLWLQDYDLDCAGALPPELKRGVLSQDGLYDLLCKITGL